VGIDEACGVPKVLWDAVETLIANEGGKLLAIGDASQLPPVRQDTSSILCKIQPAFMLREPMRFPRGSELHELETQIRANAYDVPATGNAAITLHPSMDSLYDQYAVDWKADPTEDLRALLYRRSEVVKANNEIRRRLFGAQPDALLPEEQLVVMSTQDVRGRRGYSGQRYTVDRLFRSTIDDVPCWVAEIGGQDIPILFMRDERKADEMQLGGAEYNAKLAITVAYCRKHESWQPYHAFKNQWLPVGYGYAMSVHRCQGQTVDRVYFRPRGLLRGPDARNLMYVAATRAKKAVHMVIEG